MRRIVFITTALAAAGVVFFGCGRKAAETPSVEELKGEVAAVAGELNAYMSDHNFSNTDAGALAGELTKLAGRYGELEKRAQDLKGKSGDEQYGDVAGLAGEGRAKAEVLASAVAAGPPMGQARKMAALNDAIGDWVDYNDRVGAPPSVGEPAPPPSVGEPAPPPSVGEPAPPPSVGEPAPPPSVGEPVPAPEPGEPGEPRYPGRGHHYGWWKNPEWARDRGTRPLAEGEVPGVAEKERERERERDRTGKGTGPEREREREREHVKPGGGKGAGPSGGAKGPKGGGGSGKGAGADADTDKGAGGGKGRGGK
jgi:hypothetical protein